MGISKLKERLVAFVPNELKKDLKKIAEAENRSLSGLVNFILNNYVQKWKKDNR